MRFRLLALALAALIAAYTAYWFRAAGQFEDRLRAWAAPGGTLSLSFGRLSMGGFPFRLEATLDNAVLQSVRPGHGWQAAAAQAHLTGLVWRPGHMVLAASGAQIAGHVDWPGAHAEPGAPAVRHAITGQAGTLRGSLRLEAGGGTMAPRIARLSLNLLAFDGSAPSLLGGAFQAADLQFHLREPAQQANEDSLILPERLEIVLKGRDVTLAGITPRRLGRQVAKFTVVVGVDAGSAPPARTAPALAAWRDEGGTLDVKLAAIDWGALSAEAQGDLALDENFYPIGAMTLRGQGIEDAVEDLIAAAAIPPETADMARLTLAATAQDTTPRREIALSAQQGHLYLGPVPLLPLAPVAVP